MIDNELVTRLRSMDEAAPRLMEIFNFLTQAHMFFQGAGDLRTISVSDVMDSVGVEASFRGVRVRFELLLVFSFDQRPLGRVVCTHCHCTYGPPVQDPLGAFIFGEDGATNLAPNQDGVSPRMDSDAPEIVLRFLNAALDANRSI